MDLVVVDSQRMPARRMLAFADIAEAANTVVGFDL